jgi:hypothetical protein
MALQYELELLEELISATLHPENLDIKNLKEENLHQWKEHAFREKERIRKQLIKQVFSSEKEEMIELYIQRHQFEIIRLADTVLHYISSKNDKGIHSNTISNSVKDLYKQLYLYLEELLTFIEKHFAKYFDQEGAIPISYRQIVELEVKKNDKFLQKKLSQLNVDPSLIEIILHPFKHFQTTKSAVSFREVSFLRELSKLLSNLEIREDQNPNQIIIDNLIYINYNDLILLNYITKQFTSEIMKLSASAEQLEQLSLYYKNINQTQIKPGFYYYKQQQSLKEMLQSWIQEEIEFLKTKRQLNMIIPASTIELEKQSELVQVALSAQQLSFFLKLLVEEKIILNKNQLELIRRMAKNFKTVGKEQPSAGSIRNKYYSVEQSTAKSIKDILIKMLNRINKFYFTLVSTILLNYDFPEIELVLSVNGN